MDTTHQIEVAGDTPEAPLAKFSNSYISTQAQEFTISAFIPAGQVEAVVVISFLEQRIVPIVDGSAHGVTGEKVVTATVLMGKEIFRQMTRIGNSILDQVAGLEQAKADERKNHQA